jgi:hypothetical protein
MTKRPARRLVLKENHPTMIKLEKLWRLADELGLHIGFHGHRTSLEDNDRDPKLPMLFIEDIESDDGPQDFPPATEFRVVYDNPDYLSLVEKENADRRTREEEEKRQKEELKRQREEAEARRMADELEKKERVQLARLKAKYEATP